MGIGFVSNAAADHLAPFLRGHYSVHFHGQAEPVQQLRPQVTLLRVHRPHQDKLGGMTYRNAFPLHVVASHGRGVQQHVHQVVVQQVDLVDVENAPVGRGNQAGLKAFAPGFDGLFNI